MPQDNYSPVPQDESPNGSRGRGVKLCLIGTVCLGCVGAAAGFFFTRHNGSDIDSGALAGFFKKRNSDDVSPLKPTSGLNPGTKRLYSSTLVKADLWRPYPAILSAGVGFSNYFGLPKTDEETVHHYGGQYNADGSGSCKNPKDDPPTTATGPSIPNTVWNSLGYLDDCQPPGGETMFDGTPVCFSWPIIGVPDGTDFEFTITDWNWKFLRVVRPTCAGLNPNWELNERHCVVVQADLADNSTGPDDKDGYLASHLKLKGKGEFSEKWMLVGPKGPVFPYDLEITTHGTAYKDCMGPLYVAAKLNKFSAAGEGTGSYQKGWTSASNGNSGLDLYGDAAQYRIRLFYTGGMTFNGINALTPDSFERLWTLHVCQGKEAFDATEVGKEYKTPHGKFTIVGLAELGEAKETCDEYADICYTEDRDNYLDIILSADNDDVAAQITSVSVKSGLYNPGGPGLTPKGRYTVANSPQRLDIQNDLSDKMQVTYCNDKFFPNPTEDEVEKCSEAGGVPRKANTKSTFDKPALSCKPGDNKAFSATKDQGIRMDQCPEMCYDYKADSNEECKAKPQPKST